MKCSSEFKITCVKPCKESRLIAAEIQMKLRGISEIKMALPTMEQKSVEPLIVINNQKAIRYPKMKLTMLFNGNVIKALSCCIL